MPFPEIKRRDPLMKRGKRVLFRKLLPDWEDCAIAVEEGRASALERFIYDFSPNGVKDRRRFDLGLTAVVKEAKAQMKSEEE